MQELNMQVMKRDKSLEPLDIDKIRRVINWAVEGLSVSPIELESAAAIKFYDRISTKDIHSNLIDTAQNLTFNGGVLTGDWTVVAGRLYLYNLNKDVELYYRNKGISTDIVERIEYLVKLGVYDKMVLEAVEQMTPEVVRYLWNHVQQFKKDDENAYDIAGARLWGLRYLCTHEKDIVETVTMALFVLTLILSGCEDSAEQRPSTMMLFFDAISQRKISLATPILRNLRRKDGSLTSCFITQADDSKDSIFYVVDQIASMSKHGGGVGVDMSRVRGARSSVNGIPNVSGGILPWIKIINDTAVAVNQGGARAGAVTVSIRCWHIDLLDFLQLQTENGDPRKKSFDIFPQIGVHDLFMERVVSSGQWHLVCPYEFEKFYGVSLVDAHGDRFNALYLQLENDIKDGVYTGNYKSVKARELMAHITEVQIETGMPYLAFIDTINSVNPNKDLGMIQSVNLCVESFSNVFPTLFKLANKLTIDEKTLKGKLERELTSGEVHCCNLISLNGANIKTYDEWAFYTKIAAIILDYTIDITAPPVGEAKYHNELYRTIGIGIMGWADWLAKASLRYDTQEAVDEAGKVGEIVAYASLHASAMMAKAKGVFLAYEHSEFNKGIYLGKTFEQLATEGQLGEKWVELGALVQRYGVRNSHLTAIAPNTSSSIVQHCTASILPVFGKMFMDSAGKQTVPVCPPFINEKFWHYKENKHIDQTWVVEMTAAFQKWIDTGISMELLFNLNEEGVDAPFIMRTIFKAWRKKCKTVYYIRSVQKGMNSAEDQDVCVSCAN